MIKWRNKQKIINQKIKDFALSKERFFAIEAHTGVGKTLCYLDTGLKIAREIGCRVVIATSTNSLVKQAAKDIETFNLDKNQYAFVMGKNNFVAPQQLRAAVTLKKIKLTEKTLDWLAKTQTGYISELEEFLFEIGEDSLSDETKHLINAEGYPRDSEGAYFYKKALEQAENALVIVTNHHTILQDKLWKASVLPEYGFLIVDEGHSLRQAAELILSSVFSPLQMSNLSSLLQKHVFKEEIVNSLKCIIKETNKFKKFASPGQSGKQENVPLVQSRMLKNFNDVVSPLIDEINKKENAELFPFGVNKLFGEFKELKEVLAGIDSAKVSYSPVKGVVRYSITRFNVFTFLFNFWESLDAKVLLVSGTIFVVPGEYRLLSKLGLFRGQQLEKSKFASSIQGKEWFLLMKDKTRSQRTTLTIPEPDKAILLAMNDEDNTEWAQLMAMQIAKAAEGKKTLCLVGSFVDAQALKDELQSLGGIAVAAQENVSLEKTTRMFNAYPKGTILIGTRQYWTGIDISSLDLLVVAKLPFPALSDPRWAEIKTNNSKAFWPIYLWETQMLFRQGCGRLLRDEKSKGEILLLDPRVHQTKGCSAVTWGKMAVGENTLRAIF